MKRIIAIILAAALCLSLAACRKKTVKEETQAIQTEKNNTDKELEETQRKSDSTVYSGSTAAESEETTQQSVDLVGPWHLDKAKNDLTAFSDRFPGYAEWGASMEIRSDGQMSWYIGAEGWHGTYGADDKLLHAELISDLDQSTRFWDFCIVTENESAMLEMDHEDMTIYWVYGDQEDTANGTDIE